MKALFISNDPNIFKPESDIRARLRAYAREIGEVHVISRAPVGARESVEPGLYLHPIFASNLFARRALTKAARRLIKLQSIEVVSAQDPFEYGLAAMKAVRGTEAKLHVQIHTDFLSPWFKRGFKNHLRIIWARRVLPHAQGIRVVSERIKQSLAAPYSDKLAAVSVIPIAISQSDATILPIQARSFTFAFIAVSRLEPEKRVEDILHALALVRKARPEVGILIAGEGRERVKLTRLARRLGLKDAALFLGNRSDARALMQQAQAFVQASAYEGYGATFIEAGLAKLPIVSTDVGIMGDVFKNEESALITPVADVAALAAAISRVVEDGALHAKLAQNGEAAAKVHLTAVGDIPKRIAEDLGAVLTKP